MSNCPIVQFKWKGRAQKVLIVLNYLSTLPLHHSQRELDSGDHYSDFSFDIRPTDDFLGKLFSYRDGIEILEPSDLREKMEQLIAKTLNRYSVKNSL